MSDVIIILASDTDAGIRESCIDLDVIRRQPLRVLKLKQLDVSQYNANRNP